MFIHFFLVFSFFHFSIFALSIKKSSEFCPFYFKEEILSLLWQFSKPINKKALLRNWFHSQCRYLIQRLKKASGKSIIYFHTAKNALNATKKCSIISKYIKSRNFPQEAKRGWKWCVQSNTVNTICDVAIVKSKSKLTSDTFIVWQ